MRRRDFIGVAAAGAAGLAGAGSALAQPAAYPTKLVRVVIPFAPGGGVDSLGRLVAQRLQEKLGQTFVVENKTGGSGTIGGQAVQQSPPDGYTLLFSASTHVLAKQVLRRAPYDPVTDFTPVAQIGQAPLLLVMSPNRPQTSITEIVADARKNPDRWTFGTSAFGAASHLATLLFMQLAGLNLVVAPYRGTAPALNDVAGGHTPLLIDAIPALLPFVQSGGVKGIAITTAARSALAPSIPTAAEAGMPGLEFTSWYGLWAPKGLPAPITARLDEALAEIMREPATVARFAQLGLEPAYADQAAFRRFIDADVARNTELLRNANFQPE